MKNLDFIWSLLLKVSSFLFLLLLPIRSSLVAVFALVLLDAASGVWAAYKEGKPITSSGFRRTLVKILAYESAILAAFILETYLMDGVPMVKAVSGLIGLTEGKSFFENFKRVTGIDLWSQVLSKLNMQDIKNNSDEKK